MNIFIILKQEKNICKKIEFFFINTLFYNFVNFEDNNNQISKNLYNDFNHKYCKSTIKPKTY